MPEHCFNLRDWQVQAAKAGRLGAILLPMKPQPESTDGVTGKKPGWLTWTRERRGRRRRTHWHAPTWNANGDIPTDVADDCPLGAPGDTILGRECFAAIWPPEHPDGWTVDDDGTERGLHVGECNIEYRADGDRRRLPGEWPEECRDDPDRPQWLSATRLPRPFARWRWMNGGVGVVRVVKVSEEDALACGMVRLTAEGVLPCDQLQAVWQARYGNMLPWESAWAWLVRLEPEGGDA